MTDIADAIVAVQAQLLDQARSIALAAADRLIEATPVKTGRTRDSFRASIGAPATGTDPGPVDDHNGDAARQQIAEVIQGMKPGDKLFVTSDYFNAKRMNDGDRGSPPHAMVERAAQGWGRD